MMELFVTDLQFCNMGMQRILELPKPNSIWECKESWSYRNRIQYENAKNLGATETEFNMGMQRILELPKPNSIWECKESWSYRNRIHSTTNKQAIFRFKIKIRKLDELTKSKPWKYWGFGWQVVSRLLKLCVNNTMMQFFRQISERKMWRLATD